MKNTLRKLKPVHSLGFLLAACLAGCTPLKYSRTTALPGLPPIQDVNQVRVVEEINDVTQPYQLVGKVTVYREGTRIMNGKSIERISTQAAAMGADGVIGVHRNAGGGLYSALAVKWLAPGESPRPVKFPFIVAALPVVPDPTAPGDQEKLTEVVQSVLMYPLESRGYYYLPHPVVGFDGGIAEAKALDNAALGALGGPQAQLLLELALTGRAEMHFVIGASATSYVKATMLDKQTRQVIYEGMGEGSMGGGFLANAMAPNAKRIDAAILGTMDAFRNLPPIHMEATPK